jgi:nucleotide-binding universal stress UspA family protein
MFCPSRILVPIDFTRSAAPAVAYAKDVARLFGSRVHLLHVVATPASQGWATGLPHATLDEQAEGWRLDAIEELATFAADSGCYTAGLHASHGPTLAVRPSSDPATAILSYAREEGCDLIVMGTHRSNALAAILRGSTAERVRREASCPVVLVPPAVAVPVRRSAPVVHDPPDPCRRT